MTAENLADALVFGIWGEYPCGILEEAAAEVLRLIRTDPTPDLVKAVREWSLPIRQLAARRAGEAARSALVQAIDADNVPADVHDAMVRWARRELARNPEGLGLVRELHLRSGPCYRLPDVPAAAAAASPCELNGGDE